MRQIPTSNLLPICVLPYLRTCTCLAARVPFTLLRSDQKVAAPILLPARLVLVVAER